MGGGVVTDSENETWPAAATFADVNPDSAVTAEILEMLATIRRWEDADVSRASCCMRGEEATQLLVDMLRAERERGFGLGFMSEREMDVARRIRAFVFEKCGDVKASWEQEK